MLFFSFLPSVLSEALNKLDKGHIYEIRLRNNHPVLVNFKNNFYFLTSAGLSKEKESAMIVTRQMIEGVLFKITNGSVYTFIDQIKEGFITIQGGIRIGIVGEVVREDSKIITIKNINAFNIRIPHQIIGCSKQIFPYLINGTTLCNTLIISPPGAGKTTFLRDLSVQAEKAFPHKSVLILDERYEIAASVEGTNSLNVGQADVMSGCTKQFGFEKGIRSMSPNFIFTDEIATKEDVQALLYATYCGVNVIATAHAFNLEDIRKKSYFKLLLKKEVFQRFVVLSTRKGVGTVEGVYDNHFINLWEEKVKCNLY